MQHIALAVLQIWAGASLPCLFLQTDRYSRPMSIFTNAMKMGAIAAIAFGIVWLAQPAPGAPVPQAPTCAQMRAYINPDIRCGTSDR